MQVVKSNQLNVHFQATSWRVQVLQGLFPSVPLKDAQAHNTDTGTEAYLGHQSIEGGHQIAGVVIRHGAILYLVLSLFGRVFVVMAMIERWWQEVRGL